MSEYPEWLTSLAAAIYEIGPRPMISVTQRQDYINQIGDKLDPILRRAERKDVILHELTEVNAALRAEVERMRKAAQDIIDKVEADERFAYDPASVQINAPLALIQIDLAAKRFAATRILAALDAAKEDWGGEV
jgi:hypothetical protein